MKLRLLFPLLLLAFGASAHGMHRSVAERAEGPESIRPLPQADVLRFFSSSHRTSVADLFWLNLVQYVGTAAEIERGWPHLEAIAEVVTTLDPEYGYAYQATGILLSEAGRYEASNRFLEEGMEHVPSRWELPFFAGYNYWQHLGDSQKAAALMFRASRIDRSPAYLAELSNRLYSSSGNIDEGLALLDLVLSGTEDPLVRESLERRRDELWVEKALQAIEREIETFREDHGRLPRSLAELQGGEAGAILRSPIGPSISLDPGTGEVRSSLLLERLVVYDADAKKPAGAP